MNQKNLEKYKKILIDMKMEILESIMEDSEELMDLKENGFSSSEEYDIASSLLETEMQEQIEETDLITLKEINEALNKINNGTYGICDECKKEIPLERLDFLPHAAKCNSCAKKK